MKTILHNQGSAEWKAWRLQGVGGSDVAAILGVSPYDDHTRETVFREKVTGIEREANFAMHRGQRLEPAARRAYELRHRCSAPPTCVEMDGCPWARVSLDGLCRPDWVALRLEEFQKLPAPARDKALAGFAKGPAGPDGDPWILELKCPNWMTHDEALGGVVAKHFDVQIQWQMLVVGLQRCDFASFNPGQRFTPENAIPFDRWLTMPENLRPPMPPEWLAVVEVKPDPDKQAQILEEAGKFWFEVLEARAQQKRTPAGIEAEFA